MRNSLRIFAVLLAVLGLAACDVHELPHGETRVAVTLDLKFDTSLPQYTTVYYNTKAGDPEWQTRYIVRLYKYASSDYSRDPSYTFVLTDRELDELDHKVYFMAEAANYRAVVWTDFVKAGSEDDLFYDTSDFSEVKLTGSYAGNEPMRDCFYGSTDLEMATLLTYDCTYEAEVQMGRPIAKFNFISTDRDKFIDYWVQQQAIRSGSLVKIDRNKVDLNKFTVRWVYPQFLPNTFNLHSGRPVDSATGVRFDVPMRVNEDGNVDLGFDWMFVNPTESKVVVSLEIYDQEGAYLSTVSNIEVPLMRSHFTTVEGNILTNGINNGVSIDPTYDGEFTIIL